MMKKGIRYSKDDLSDIILNVMDRNLYIDVDHFIALTRMESKKITKEFEDESDELSGVEETEGFSINAPMYEIIKLLLEILLTSREDVDEKMGMYSLDATSIPFKLSFNTLIKYNIIKEIN